MPTYIFGFLQIFADDIISKMYGYECTATSQGSHLYYVELSENESLALCTLRK